jgi:hypothetical protein
MPLISTLLASKVLKGMPLTIKVLISIPLSKVINTPSKAIIKTLKRLI